MTTLRKPMPGSLSESYSAGWFDGLKEGLAQIMGDSDTIRADGMYRGPIPDELREWVTALRARLETMNP